MKPTAQRTHRRPYWSQKHDAPRGRKARRPEYPQPDAHLRAIFSQIGSPEPRRFRPDPFQITALKLLKQADVVVSAPTGSGKTWIAQEAIKGYLKKGRRVWYASPLKALSNAKYEEFSTILGPEKVGILTGDRKDNPGAPVIVGTTEILRNQLYDTMRGETPLEYALVVLDEAHYLGESDRGVVWEETLIYLPASIRILMLSATIQNCQEIARWLESIRGAPCSVVSTEERPVPLHALFLYPDGNLTLLSGRRGLRPEVQHYMRWLSRKRRRSRSSSTDYGYILNCLRQWNLLPAIFFLTSRAECDRALMRCPPVSRDPEDQQRMHKDLELLLQRLPYLRHHRGVRSLEDSRVASHHAGHLPFWKVLVEQMMLQGHLDAIFATSTVAGGVNFPARTVVLVQSDRYDGTEFKDLSATELQQMIGRAGRRGKDQVGFVLIVPGPHQDPYLIHERLRSPPDPIESQIHINFSMVLNLLQSSQPEEIRQMLGHSLAAYQQTTKVRDGTGDGVRTRQRPSNDIREDLWKDVCRHLAFLKETGFVDGEDKLTTEGHWAARLRLDHPLLVAEAIRKGSFRDTGAEMLAGLIAPFVMDDLRDIPLEGGTHDIRFRKLRKNLEQLKKDLKYLNRKHKQKGFKAAEIPLWPAVALYLWAQGVSWRGLLRAVPIEEGDMAMLITRTADHLRQIAGLHDVHPEIAEAAREAIDLIFREPVWM
jgi:ATP-dependent RNA helicase HelY